MRTAVVSRVENRLARESSRWFYHQTREASSVKNHVLRRMWEPGGYSYGVNVAEIRFIGGVYVGRALDAEALDLARSTTPQTKMADYLVEVCRALSVRDAILEVNLWMLARGWSLPVYTDEQAAMSSLFWERQDEDLAITGSLVPVPKMSPWKHND
jgi:hypothetical protein